MRRRYEVKEGGRLDGLHAIGFHGEIDPAQTPGRREAILTDDAWHLIGLEDMALEEGKPSTKAVWGQVGARVESGSLPSVSTQLELPLPAYLGHIVVVLGHMEMAHIAELSTTETHVEASRASALLRWLHDPASTPQFEMMAQRRGEVVMWYCSVADAFALYQRIGRVAEKEMVRASNESNEKALYEASWWLARASLDDSDRYFAVVGLERSNRSIADAYLKATFRRRPAEEIEAALRHARGVFDGQCVDARRKMAGPVVLGHSAALKPEASTVGVTSIGATLFGSRARMRQRYIVAQRRAA